MVKALTVCLVVLVVANCVTSRWLPTRSQEDRLDKLREMLKELLESEIEKSNYENKYMYKREVEPQIERIQTAEDTPERLMSLRTNNNNNSNINTNSNSNSNSNTNNFNKNDGGTIVH